MTQIMRASDEEKFLDTEGKPQGRSPGQIIKHSQPEIGMAAQIRRMHPGGFLDWTMDQKSIPGLNFKGIGVPPMAIIWFFLGGFITAAIYGSAEPIFRMLGFGVFYQGKNIWNGQLPFSSDPIIAVTLLVLVVLLILSNIEYLARMRVLILGLIFWLTISFSIGSAWSDFYRGNVGLLRGYNFNTLSYDSLVISPAPNWLLILLASGIVAMAIFIPLGVLNWITKKLRERG